MIFPNQYLFFTLILRKALLTKAKDTTKNKRVAASVNLTEGPLFKRIILYTIPIILTGLLQLLFNAADIIVVGNSSNETALSAVGATSALINLIVNLLIGLSVGAGVIAARCYGSHNEKGMHQLVHTAIPTAAIGGIIFGVIGFVFGGTFLSWMDTPDNVIAQATLYIKIYSVGIPFSIVYNFGAAILRSVGDTTRPLIFLVISGVVNVIFNLIFVFAFGMDVDGVATATAISQALSSVMVIIYMMRVKDSHRFEIKKMHFYKDKFIQILAIGLPAGIQGSLFSISNVIIQKSINSFGDIAMAGNTSAANIEGFIYTAMNAFHQTALNFTGQHFGANKLERIKKISALCILSVSVVGIVLGVGAYAFAHPLLSIYSPGKEQVIAYGILRMKIIALTYFTCGIMDVLSGLLRGLGYSLSSMLITLTCVCGLRIVWIYTFFKAHNDFTTLFLSYPISWVVCCVAQFALFIFAYHRVLKKDRLNKLEEKLQEISEQIDQSSRENSEQLNRAVTEINETINLSEKKIGEQINRTAQAQDNDFNSTSQDSSANYPTQIDSSAN